MKIKGVKIGDKFIMNGKAKVKAKVVDIYTVYNSKNEIVKYMCIAENNFLGQAVRFETAFATVVRNKID